MKLTMKICSAMTAGALLALPACGSSNHKSSTTTPATTPSSGTPGDQSDGITPTSITIGQIADISGPIPGLTQGAKDGIEAWAAYIDSKGGIKGRKIIVDSKDDGLNCVSFQNELKGLSSSVAAMVGTMSLVDTCGVSIINAADYAYIPTIAVSNALKTPSRNVVSPWPNPPGVATAGLVWMKNKYGTAAIEHTGTFYATSTAGPQASEVAAAESLGYKYIYSREVGDTETNFTSDILRMKQAGVQIVDLTTPAVTMDADFLSQAAQQNFHPLAVYSTQEYDGSLLKLVSNPADLDNVIANAAYSLYLGQDAGTVPEINTMTQWVQKVRPGATMSLLTVEGWLAGLLFQEALEKAGSTPTRASILAAVKSIKSFTGDGLQPNMDPADDIPSNCSIIVGVRNGQFYRIDPPSKGFDCSLGKYFYKTS